MSDIQFEVIVTACNLSSKTNNGWVKQLNLVKWGDRDPVWDIRSWHYPDGNPKPDKMSKGVSLSKDEMVTLVDYVNRDDFNRNLQKYLTASKIFDGKVSELWN